MAPFLAACPASKPGNRSYLMLGGLEWPLIASILSRIQNGSAKIVFFCLVVAENNKGFYFRKNADWSRIGRCGLGPSNDRIFFFAVWAEVFEQSSAHIFNEDSKLEPPKPRQFQPV